MTLHFLPAVLHRVAFEERGQTAIATVLIFLGVFAVAGMAMDGGLWYFDHRNMQNAVDAAALAAVGNPEMPTSNISGPAADAIDWLKRNGVPSSIADAATVTTMSDDPTMVSQACSNLPVDSAKVVFLSPDGTGPYYGVIVCVRRHSAVTLSGLGGIRTATVSAGAKAHLDITPLTYSLMAMNPDDCAGGGDGQRSLNFAGSPGVVVNLLQDGGTYTRSTCDGAMYIDGGNITVNAEGVHDVVGVCEPTSRCLSSQVNPDPINHFPDILPDPWASFTQPTPGTCRTDNGFTGAVSPAPVTFSSGTVTLSPGTYCQPLVVSSSATVNLASGTHIFREGVMVSGNSARLLSSGSVVVYMTCSSGNSCAGASVKVPPQAPGCSTSATFCLQGGSGSTVNLTGPSAEPGIVIWVDRTAQANNTPMVRIAGQGSITIDGNVYDISGTVQFQGQGSGQVINLTGTIVADKIEFTGQATYNVTWDADLAPKRLDPELVE
jgi:hypothetical protein